MAEGSRVSRTDLVDLDHELQRTLLVLGRDRGVRSNHGLSLVIETSLTVRSLDEQSAGGLPAGSGVRVGEGEVVATEMSEQLCLCR